MDQYYLSVCHTYTLSVVRFVFKLSAKAISYISQFGRGPRACVGKNVALMELSKMIPELILRFDVSLADPNYGWTVHSDGAVKPEDFLVRLTKRKAMD